MKNEAACTGREGDWLDKPVRFVGLPQSRADPASPLRIAESRGSIPLLLPLPGCELCHWLCDANTWLLGVSVSVMVPFPSI